MCVQTAATGESQCQQKRKFTVCTSINESATFAPVQFHSNACLKPVSLNLDKFLSESLCYIIFEDHIKRICKNKKKTDPLLNQQANSASS